jgi:hypothetical protein
MSAVDPGGPTSGTVTGDDGCMKAASMSRNPRNARRATVDTGIAAVDAKPSVKGH